MTPAEHAKVQAFRAERAALVVVDGDERWPNRGCLQPAAVRQLLEMRGRP